MREGVCGAMEKFWKSAAASLGCLPGFLFGELDGLVIALIALMCIDYVTGVIVGAVRHKLNSSTGFKGLAKKMLIMLIVAVANIIDTQVFKGENSIVRSAVCFLYIGNEGLSILENAGKLGLPMPQKLKSVLEQLRDKDEKEE